MPPDIDVAACPDWTTQIFPLFDETGAYGCALAQCHGVPPGGAGLFMPPGNASDSYDNMALYAPNGRPYVGEGRQDEAYLLCNLSPDTEVNLGTAVMPKLIPGVPALAAGADLKLIGEWANCGMPKGGGAGGGGVGGAGGGL